MLALAVRVEFDTPLGFTAPTLQTLGNSWFSIVPVALFAIAGVAPWDAGPALLVAALGAEFVPDFGVSAMSFAVGAR